MGEGDCSDLLMLADESVYFLASCHVPQTNGRILARRRKCFAIGGECYVEDDFLMPFPTVDLVTLVRIAQMDRAVCSHPGEFLAIRRPGQPMYLILSGCYFLFLFLSRGRIEQVDDPARAARAREGLAVRRIRQLPPGITREVRGCSSA